MRTKQQKTPKKPSPLPPHGRTEHAAHSSTMMKDENYEKRHLNSIPSSLPSACISLSCSPSPHFPLQCGLPCLAVAFSRVPFLKQCALVIHSAYYLRHFERHRSMTERYSLPVCQRSLLNVKFKPRILHLPLERSRSSLARPRSRRHPSVVVFFDQCSFVPLRASLPFGRGPLQGSGAVYDLNTA